MKFQEQHLFKDLIQGFNSRDLSSNMVILIGAVDNNKSRQMCHRVFKEMKELIYIDSGNGEFTGQVVCGIKRNNRSYYKPVGELYPDILSETDKFPSELSCAEASISAPQSIAANIMASTLIVSYVYNILVLGQMTTRSVTFSSKTGNCRADISLRKKRVNKPKKVSGKAA